MINSWLTELGACCNSTDKWILTHTIYVQKFWPLRWEARSTYSVLNIFTKCVHVHNFWALRKVSIIPLSFCVLIISLSWITTVLDKHVNFNLIIYSYVPIRNLNFVTNLFKNNVFFKIAFSEIKFNSCMAGSKGKQEFGIYMHEINLI